MGMRIVRSMDELQEGIDGAMREAVSSFGDGRLIVERYLPRARHIEVQVFADSDLRLPYVPGHLHQCLFELIKNSLRAVTDRYMDADEDPPPVRLVVADGDDGLDLDTIAALSRTASELLDGLDTPPYVLEVTSPGVDRPLTTPTHFRRARGRRVEIMLTDGATVSGRLGDCGDQTVAQMQPQWF